MIGRISLDGDLKIIFVDRRFCGVRIGLAGLVVTALGFLLAIFLWRTLGAPVMLAGWLATITGLFMHLGGRAKGADDVKDVTRD